MKIYLASPLFNEEEIANIDKVEKLLRAKGHTVYSPREHEYRGAEAGTHEWAMQIFMEDRQFIDWADCLVMLYYGNYSDSGTAWECGYAYGTHTPVIVVQLGKDSNLMVHCGSHTNVTMEQLENFDFEMMPKYNYQGSMF
ncbi:MAG: nucleoside 2-deoxyribosyltransferase [Firmicutes bacterium]|nr:nucleoside 2-deoxyribosyltransferase [Bacillota bacterium]